MIEAVLRAEGVRQAVLEAKVKWARGSEALEATRRARRGPRRRGAGSGARGASLDWLVELEREEDGEREDKCGAAAFGVHRRPPHSRRELTVMCPGHYGCLHGNGNASTLRIG